MRHCLLAASALAALAAAGPARAATAPHRPHYFTIRVVDAQTGRGVPLVELRTVHNIRYHTDSNGIAAFHEPGLMGRSVFFHVRSHGYEFPKDGFGNRGKALKVVAGASATLKLRRVNIAERLYRVTGAGIYRDSVLVGHPTPIREPVLNAQVLGSDSVLTALYKGKVHWFWGDTNRPGYPLGNFHVPGATSLLPKDGGLDPEVGVNLSYFLDRKGFAKETCRMPGRGPTWIGGLVVLRDASGRERMFAAYVKVRGFLEVYQRGLVEWNDAKEQFEKVAEFPVDAPVRPHGHPFKHTSGGTEYIYFGDPYPLTRVRADVEHLKRLDRYEAFTCLKGGSRLDDPQLDRAPDGTLRYAWRKNTPPVGPREQAKLIQAGKLKAQEALLHLRDVDTGKPVVAHRGSMCWNAWRRRWVLIAGQAGGSTSNLGEIWFAEADAPLGPWVYARKIVTHDRYSFYNPKQHPMFDKDGGRTIFFEGTYTALFSGNKTPTPRYNYNQIMYKLDLTDTRLALPVAIYSFSQEGAPFRSGAAGRAKATQQRGTLAFFALDRPTAGAVPVYEWPSAPGERALRIGEPPRPGGEATPLFHALPTGAAHQPPTTVPLYEFVHKDGKRRAYSVQEALPAQGWRRLAKPLCLVWRSPFGPRTPAPLGPPAKHSP